MTKMNKFIRLWVTPKVPRRHIYVEPDKRPKELYQLARMYFRKWTVHPLKRHLAHVYSRVLVKNGCEIIGITGSAGKTTVKEMIASVLSQKYKTVWTPANIDPVYNIPTTILKTPLNTERLVLEMGIEFSGEMDFYLWLAQPQIGAMTNIYWTHTEFFGDIDGVFKEKSKLVKSLPRGGWAILNRDDPRLLKIKGVKANVIWYGRDKKADIRAENVRISENFKTDFTLINKSDQIDVSLPLLGGHFVDLALTAAAVGRVDDLSLEEIKRGLEKVTPQPHRMTPIRLKDGTLLLDDAYNANPLAVTEALNVLSQVGRGKRKIFVFGEMKELGQYEEKGHREVGREVAKTKVDYLLTLGELTQYTINEAVRRGLPKSHTFLATDKEELLAKIMEIKKRGDVILIKGSRSMAMEEIVEKLR